MVGARGLEVGGNGEQGSMGTVSVRGDEDVLEADGGGGCTTV